jgi:CHAT domain-containing protein
MNLQTSARLAVLSDAQHNDNLNGAAIYGLSWSWFVAGSPLVMFNRWKLETAPASNLLTQFYSTIKPPNGNRISRAKALRQSALSLRRSSEFQHPYYWARFALIGDER